MRSHASARPVALPVRRLPRFHPISLFHALASLRRQRMTLGQLDDRMLKDIGLERAAAEAEAKRPLWDAPDHWFQRR